MKPTTIVKSSLLTLFVVAQICAQDLTGVISGIVKDTSGAVVPGAEVTVVNAETTVLAWHGKSDGAGNYLAPLLPVGVYNISVESKGFRKSEIRNFDLKVNQRARIDATLQAGDISNSVTVSGDNVAQLETETSAMGVVIDTNQVADLPMANRAVFSMIMLAGGVSTGAEPTAPDSSQYSINGSRTQGSEITIDGVSVFGGATGAISPLPSPDAVREVKILTSSYPAEYGRTSGATISMVVKSGTNRYHGALYEYFRNEDLDANNFFNNLRATTRPEDRQNQIGGSFSGPVWLPKLYRGKDRTFFFANYETTRKTSPAAPISTIPGVAFRSGDFSASPAIVDDPTTHKPFPGNQIPVTRIDPAAAKIIALLPAPDSPGSFDPTTGVRANNYINNTSTQPFTNNITTRLDHNMSNGTAIWLRFTHNWSMTPQPATIPGPLNPGTGTSTGTQWIGAAGVTKSITSNLYADVRYSYLRNAGATLPTSLGTNVPEVLGIQRSPMAATPLFTLSGWTTLGSPNNGWQTPVDNIFQFTPTLTWIHGPHSMKTGVEFRKNQYNNFNGNNDYAGLYNFNGNITSPTFSTGNPVNSFADFLLGDITNVAYTIPQPEIGRRNYNLAVFFQDDWKITPKLTLNLGLRDEYEAPQTSSNGVYSRIDVNTGQLLVAGLNSDASLGLHPPKYNFGPRIGFAYAIDSKTVVRSATGIFYYQLFSNLGGNITMPGFNGSLTIGGIGNGTPQPFSLSQGTPLTAKVYANPLDALKAATPSNPLTPSIQYAEVNHIPMIQQWNFGIQREVARGTVIDISYVGNHDIHLPLYLRFNTLPSFYIAQLIEASGSSVSTQQYRPFPDLAGWSAATNVGTSHYHSLQIRASREYSRSLSFLATYTFAKSTDDGSGTFANTQPSGTLDNGQVPQIARYLDRAVSSFDRTHTLVVVPRYTQALGPRWLRGWNADAIFTVRSGLPSTVYQNQLLPDAIEQRPNINAPISQLYAPKEITTGTGIEYLRPTTDPLFPLSPTGPLYVTVSGKSKVILPAGIGDIGRDTLRNPGDINVNLSVNRRFRFTEKAGLEIRADAFNAMNHVNLGPPSTSLTTVANASTQSAVWSSPGFGLITTARAARFMQLSARFEF